MEIRVEQADAADKPIIQNLMQLYLYEISRFEGPEEYRDVNPHGLFRYDHLDHYWAESGRLAFLIRVDKKLAGFILVNHHSLWLRDHTKSTWFMAEFFVMRRYQRLGVGEEAARWIFNMLPGYWEVAELDVNLDAQRFWRKVISRYTGENYEEVYLSNEDWCGPVQIFTSVSGSTQDDAES